MLPEHLAAGKHPAVVMVVMDILVPAVVLILTKPVVDTENTAELKLMVPVATVVLKALADDVFVPILMADRPPPPEPVPQAFPVP